MINRPAAASSKGPVGGRTIALRNAFSQTTSRKGPDSHQISWSSPAETCKWLGRDRVGDPARLGQCRFLGAFDEHHIDDAEHVAGFRIVDRTATIARDRPSRRVEALDTTLSSGDEKRADQVVLPQGAGSRWA